MTLEKLLNVAIHFKWRKVNKSTILYEKLHTYMKLNMNDEKTHIECWGHLKKLCDSLIQNNNNQNL